jgi:uncharacterized protein (TIGR03382 family)
LNSYRSSCAPTLHRILLRGLLALVIAAPLSARAATVWVASSTDKIGPKVTLPATLATSAALSAAKNEFEAFQIAVSGAAAGVSATATALTGPGAPIPAPRLFREALIQVASPSATDGGTGWYPDALVPDVDDVVGEKRNAFPFDVPASETRVLWVELHVPADAAPGVYTGAVTVHLSGGDVAVPVSLNVWDFALPSTSSLRSHFGLAWGDLPAGHGVSDATPDLAALRARYSQLGLDHRISLGSTDDGYAASDLSHFVQYYGPLCDGTAPTQLKGAQLTTVTFRGGSATGSGLTTAARSWVTEFKKHALPDGKTWFDKLFDYTCDEPPTFCKNQTWGDINTRSAALKAADPNFRTLVTTTLPDADKNGVTNAIDILVPIVNDLDNKPGYDNAGPQRSKYDGFVAARAGREVWTYQSCMSHGCGGSDGYFTGWPSIVIDALSMRARAEQWLSFLFDLSGELYWDSAYAYQLGDAWTSQWAAEFTGNGDGTLFYPGTPAKIGGSTHIPVASLRLKMIREGMEDFEYLKALSDAGDPQLARDLASALFPNAWSEPTAAQLLSTRHTIAERIVALTRPADPGSPPGGAPPPPPQPSDTGTDPESAPAPITGHFVVSGSGCSAGAGAEILAGLGALAALALRRRRRS